MLKSSIFPFFHLNVDLDPFRHEKFYPLPLFCTNLVNFQNLLSQLLLEEVRVLLDGFFRVYFEEGDDEEDAGEYNDGLAHD